MPIAIKKHFMPPTDAAAVAAFEQSLQARLPQEYRDFLLESNGGEPADPAFRFGDEAEPYADSAVRYFFSIGDHPRYGLAYQHKIYTQAKRVPADMLPIATDAGGNLVLLALDGMLAGKVFFWDHDIEGLVDDPSSAEHLAPLAESFGDFCAALRPFD